MRGTEIWGISPSTQPKRKMCHFLTSKGRCKRLHPIIQPKSFQNWQVKLTYLKSEIGLFILWMPQRKPKVYSPFMAVVWSTFKTPFCKHTLVNALCFTIGGQIALLHNRKQTLVRRQLTQRWDPGWPAFKCRSPWLLTLTTTLNDLDLADFSMEFQGLTACLKKGTNGTTLYFAATSFLALDLNAWHQNLESFPLYTAKTTFLTSREHWRR